MKNFLILFFLISFNSFGAEKISIDDLSAKVKEGDYLVLENAERVYQAKERVKFGKRNLLPRLNLWNIIKVPFDYSAAIDLIQDIAPFLVPANWFQMKQDQILYKAHEDQYKALLSNEVLTAKLLYVNVLKDQEFLDLLKKQRSEIQNLINIAEVRSKFGGVSPEDVNFLKIRELEVREDVRKLGLLILDELKEISFMMGLDVNNEIELSPVDISYLESEGNIFYDDLEAIALERSPEISQFTHLKNALKYTRKKAWFSFLGSSSFSSGIFDNIPIQDGLGFGTTSSILISKSEGRILDINQEKTKEVLKRNLHFLVNAFNSYLKNTEFHKERVNLSYMTFELLKTKFYLGENVSVIEILNSSLNYLEASLAYKSFSYDTFLVHEKIKRLTFGTKDYE